MATGLRGANRRERCADLGKLLGIRFAQKFQRDVHGFRTAPSAPRGIRISGAAPSVARALRTALGKSKATKRRMALAQGLAGAGKR